MAQLQLSLIVSRIHLIFPECTAAMARELCLLTVGAVVLPVWPLEMAEAGGPGWPLSSLLSPAADITEDREDFNSGEAASLGLTSLASDSKKKSTDKVILCHLPRIKEDEDEAEADLTGIGIFDPVLLMVLAKMIL